MEMNVTFRGNGQNAGMHGTRRLVSVGSCAFLHLGLVL